MHSFPLPIAHRDLKSANVLVTSDFHGKVSDCGESRRVDADSTMTMTGTPLWAAPELLAGDRYDEGVDTYSFGIILYELFMAAAGHRGTDAFPYAKRRAAYRARGGKGVDFSMLQEISKGIISAELDPEVEERVPVKQQAFSLFRRCTAFRPLERLTMASVVREMQSVAQSLSSSRYEKDNRVTSKEVKFGASSALMEINTVRVNGGGGTLGVKAWLPNERVTGATKFGASSAHMEILTVVDGEISGE